MSGDWFSIEVIDGRTSAGAWAEAFGDQLVTEALSDGALDWAWHHHPWGVVLELEFADEAAWLRFQTSMAMLRALDAVPDPVSGVIIYRGRGGGSATKVPRRPRPLIGSGSAALPIPLPWIDEIVAAHPQRQLTAAS